MENIENNEAQTNSQTTKQEINTNTESNKQQDNSNKNYYRQSRDNRQHIQRNGNHRRKKVCVFCAERVDNIDYKDTVRLKKCLSEHSKILPRRVSGNCAKHQRQLTIAVKRARTVALLPYVSD